MPGALADLALDTELDVLNDGDGVDIKTDPAFTAPLPVVSTVRQLSGDATFTITLDGDPTAHKVVVPQDQTNANLAELVADINTAIAHVTALADKIQAVADGNRISLKAVPTVTSFSLTAAQGDPAIKDLGFCQAQAAKGPLVGDSLDRVQAGQRRCPFHPVGDWHGLSSNGAIGQYRIDNGQYTIDNLVPMSMPRCSSLSHPSLDSKIVAAKSGTALDLRIADESIAEVKFTAAIDDPAVLELGFTNQVTITHPIIQAVKDLALVVGRLSQDVTITFHHHGWAERQRHFVRRRHRDQYHHPQPGQRPQQGIVDADAQDRRAVKLFTDGRVTFNVRSGIHPYGDCHWSSSRRRSPTAWPTPHFANLVEDINDALPAPPHDRLSSRPSPRATRTRKARVKFEAA